MQKNGLKNGTNVENYHRLGKTHATKKPQTHPRRHTWKQQQQQHRASPGVANTLAATSIQKEQMHTRFPGTN